MPTIPRFGFALEHVPDVPTATRFLTEVPGLDLERSHPTFAQFRDRSGVRFAIAGDARLLPGVGPEVYWVVEDAAAAFAALAPRVSVALPLTGAPFGTVFGLADPAGRVHFLVAFAAARPTAAVAGDPAGA